ncbi:MAG TPA: polysaccharide biosynthesis tyrosine autokinase [Bacteroidetes bacterium]|nr:polysaccharide biosynthesis tyrosine autokinase [Bacteroidota bacterium]
MDPHQEYIYQEENIDIKKFLLRILGNWYWFAISLFIAITAAYLFNRYSEPIYSVSATLIARGEEKGKTGMEGFIEGMEIVTRQVNVEDEMEILRSYTLTNQALRKLDDFDVSYVLVGRRGIKESKLYNRSPFVVELDTLYPQLPGHKIYITLLNREEFRLEIDEHYDIDRVMKFGEPFVHPPLAFTVKQRNPEEFDPTSWSSNKFYFVVNNLNALTNAYRSKLSVEVNDPKKGSVLTLTTQGFVAQQEADYLNKLIEVYIDYGREEKSKNATLALQFIDEQLKEIVDSLESVEQEMLEFRLRYNIIDLSQEGAAIAQKLIDLQKEKTMLGMQQKYYHYLQGYIRERGDFSDVIAPSVMGVNEPLLTNLIARLTELYSERTTLEHSAQRFNPSVTLNARQIEETRQILLEHVSSMIESAALSMKDIDRRMAEVEKDIQQLPVTERALIGIERKFQVNDEIYTYMLQKRMEAGIAKASNLPDNRMLDQARAENAARVKPKTSMNYMIALILGFVVPVVIILLIDFFNNRIVDRKDIEDHTSVPVIGSVGHNKTDSEIPVFLQPKSSIAESFRALRTNLQYMLREKGENIVLISSTVSGEGKTFIATNLAVIVAMSGRKTLLVGLDLRKPKIHRDFNITNETGLSTYLINQSELDDIIHPTDIENLYVVTSGPVPPNPAELLETGRMATFMEHIRKEYDMVILDTPPVAVVTDAILVSKYSHANIFVVRHNFSHKNVIQFIDEIYKRKDIRNISLLINDIKLHGYYGYGYGYRYGYGYGYNYGYGYGYGYGSDYYSDDDNAQGSLFRRLLHSAGKRNRKE